MEPDRGFGGWLAFFFISVVSGIAAQGYWLVQGGGSLHAWSTSEQPYARSVLALEAARTVIHAGIFCTLVIGIWLFVNEDRRTPAFWTAYFAAVIPVDVAFGLLGAALSSRVSGQSFATAAVAHVVETTSPIVFAVA